MRLHTCLLTSLPPLYRMQLLHQGKNHCLLYCCWLLYWTVTQKAIVKTCIVFCDCQFYQILLLWDCPVHLILTTNCKHLPVSLLFSIYLSLFQVYQLVTLHGPSTRRQKKSSWTWSQPCREVTHNGLSSELWEWVGGYVTSTPWGKWWRRYKAKLGLINPRFTIQELYKNVYILLIDWQFLTLGIGMEM